ncbi:MAG TPA: winged helix-turn-helix domain-containing protein [Anaerolineales bacterium]|nr:winged helix-turn-helix domain-containing protein [Anaerolineales bacterium]
MADSNTPYLRDPIKKEHFLEQTVTRLGRAVENEIVIVSKRASREHAHIRRDGRRVFLDDLGSTNGTFLNGERVLGSVQLRDGDEISVGEVVFTFHDPDTTTRETPFPELEVNVEAGVVRLNRHAIQLSPKEFSLLAYLYENRGKVCSKDEIGRTVWSEYQAGIYDYQIENLIRRLRTKIESDANAPVLLITVRGLGYKLLGKTDME